MYLSLEEFAVRAGQEVLMEVDDSSALIVVDLRGILGKQFWPRPIKLLNIIFRLW